MSKKVWNWDEWDAIESAEFGQQSLKKGVYIGVIKNVTDYPVDEYIKVDFDINEGEHKGMFSRIAENMTDWPYDASDRRYYRARALPFFKAFITAVEKSNPGYSFKGTNGDFAQLKGKIVVVVFADYEIPVPDEANDFKPKVRAKFKEFRSLQAKEEGKIKVPEGVIPLDDYNIDKYNEALKEFVAVTSVPASAGTDASAEALYDSSKKIASEDDLPF